MGDEYFSRATGLIPHTKEELKAIEKEWKEIDAVRPNNIAIERINNKRQEDNLPQFTKEEIELLWEKNIKTIMEGNNLPNQQQLDYLPSVDNSKLPAFPPIRNVFSLISGLL